MDSMIYGVSHNRKRGIVYDYDENDMKPSIEKNLLFLIIIHQHKHISLITLENPKFSETLGELILKDPKDYGYQKIK
jgi:hypothetical protein